MSKFFSRTDQSVVGRWWWTIDRGLLFAILTLIVTGVVLVTTASPPVAERIGLSNFHFVKRHFILLIPALGLMLGASFLSVRNIWRCASLILAGGILAMIFVLLFGVEAKGATATRILSASAKAPCPKEAIKSEIMSL